MSQLQGKVALVTGASRGIGRAAALELARRGADVVITARSRAELESVAREIEALGVRALALPANLDESGVAEQVVETTQSTLGSIGVLINNAAMAGPFGATWEVDPDTWEGALRLNLHVPFRLSRAVIPSMLASGWGRIINVSSGAARFPMERSGPYSISKAGLDMLTRILGVELEGSGVAAISLHPGIVDTAMQTAIREQPVDVIGDAMASRFREYHASGGLQEPDRPGRLLAVLAGEAGARFNGEIVDIYTDEAQHLIDAG
jgi:NAD(P)-dependent dehydrogenase (short-subunit alcohol dehydrogenase family)